MYSSQCKISRFNVVKPSCTVTNVFLANRSPHISAEFYVQLQNLNRKKKKVLGSFDLYQAFRGREVFVVTRATSFPQGTSRLTGVDCVLHRHAVSFP